MSKMERVEMYCYYSKTFNIITTWDGGKTYTLDVVEVNESSCQYCGGTGVMKVQGIVANCGMCDASGIENQNNLLDRMSIDDETEALDFVDKAFEKLKTKYILDHEQKLSKSRTT